MSYLLYKSTGQDKCYRRESEDPDSHPRGDQEAEQHKEDQNVEDYQGILVKFTQKMGRGGVKSPQIKTISNSFVHALTCMSNSLKSKSNKKRINNTREMETLEKFWKSQKIAKMSTMRSNINILRSTFFHPYFDSTN